MVWLLSFIVLACVGGFLFYASYSIGSGVYVKALCKGQTSDRVICLTFDDGPDPEYTPPVLDVLKRYQVPAAFFCIGDKARENPAILRRIVSEGHHVGNHSDGHAWTFPLLSYKEMRADVISGENTLKALAGPIRTFRPPFGVTNPTIRRLVDDLRYTVIGWSIRSFDTRGESEEKVFHRIVRQIKPGAVLLLHDRMPGCAALLARLLEHLKSINYQVVALDEMFNILNPNEKKNE